MCHERDRGELSRRLKMPRLHAYGRPVLDQQEDGDLRIANPLHVVTRLDQEISPAQAYVKGEPKRERTGEPSCYFPQLPRPKASNPGFGLGARTNICSTM